MAEQLNIEGKRSGDGFVCHRLALISALVRALAVKALLCGVEVGRKGLIAYLRALGGSNIVKVTPANRGLRVVCGSNTSLIPRRAWIPEKAIMAEVCTLRVAANNSVAPNVGASELAAALARVIPFVSKDDKRPVLRCVHFAHKDGTLTLEAADGIRAAIVALDYHNGGGEFGAIVKAENLKGLVAALRTARRARLSYSEDGPTVLVETEAVTYTLRGESGTFPNLAQITPTEFAAEARFDTAALVRAAISLRGFGEGLCPLRLTIGEGLIRVSNPDDTASAEVEALTNGEAKTGIAAAHLAQAARMVGGMGELKVSSPTGPIVLEADGYTVMVMPMALKDTVEAPAQAKADRPKGKKARIAAAEAKAKGGGNGEGEAPAQAPAEAEVAAAVA